MLFYLSIFVAILIATLHGCFFYTVATNRNRSVHTSNTGITTTDSSKRLQKEETCFKTDLDSPVPSVKEGGLVSSNLSKKDSAIPVARHNEETTRDLYEERLSSMYESYKARRRSESEPLALEKVCKPFKRKVAPWAKNNRTATRPWDSQQCLIPTADPTYSELTRAGYGNAE